MYNDLFSQYKHLHKVIKTEGQLRISSSTEVHQEFYPNNLTLTSARCTWAPKLISTLNPPPPPPTVNNRKIVESQYVQ